MMLFVAPSNLECVSEWVEMTLLENKTAFYLKWGVILLTMLSSTCFAIQQKTLSELEYTLSQEDKEYLVKHYLNSNKKRDKSDAKQFINDLETGEGGAAILAAIAFDEGQMYHKSRQWFSVATEAGIEFGATRLAHYTMHEIGGTRDLVTGIYILNQLVDSKLEHSSRAYIFALEDLKWMYGFETKLVKLHWFEHFADSGIDIDIWRTNDIGLVKAYEIIGREYETTAESEISRWYDRSVSRIRNNLSRANEYYRLSKRTERIAELEEIVEGELGRTRATYPSELKLCENIFDHRHRDLKEYQAFQKRIIRFPTESEKIIKEYRNQIKNRYYNIEEDRVSLDLVDTSLEQILNIYYGFKYDRSHTYDTFFSLDVPASKVRFSTYMKNFPFTLYLNLVLAHFSLDVRCGEHSINIGLSTDSITSNSFFTSHFISSWSGSFVETSGTLTGLGFVDYEGVFNYEGSFKNNLAEGKGRYIFMDGVRVLEGNGFSLGVLSGKGSYSYDGKVYEGEFRFSEITGKGRIGKFEYRYNGDLKDGLPHGYGTMIHVKRDDKGLIKLFYPLEDDAPEVSYYKGNFVEGKKQGLGECGIANKDETYNTFSCTFSNDNLIKVGDQSLIPSKAGRHNHLENIPMTPRY